MRFIRLPGAALLLAPGVAHAQAAPNDSADQPIVVTAQRLDVARDSIQPAIGASTTTIARAQLEAQPGGLDRDMNKVLQQAPGVDQDADNDGGVHVRNEHLNVQYRLDGIVLPESFAGFGPPVDTRIASSIQVITGTLPAQYGLRTAGVVALTTLTSRFDLDGDVGVYGGSHGTIQPSASIRDAFGKLNVFASGSYYHSDIGIEAPTPDRKVLHDKTNQWRGFGYASYVLSDSSRLTAFGGSEVGKFQIPNTPGQQPQFTLNGRTDFNSALLDQNERNQTHFGVLSYQYSGDGLDLQIAPFVRSARAHYTPDLAGGLLLFNGADSDLLQKSLAWGGQADASLKLGSAHTVRFGLYFSHEHVRSDSISRVFPVDANGDQASDVPLVVPVHEQVTGKTWSAYLQDEWKLGDTLTFNYGVRYDHFSAGHVSEGQLSPRAGLVWKPTPGTTVHLGYARYFSPPPLELIGANDVAAFVGTTGESPSLVADPVRAQREHSFDVGVQQVVGPLTLGADVYYKIARNLLDEGQFGGTQIQTPFNYAKAHTWGVELTANYEHGPLEAYLNVARGQQKATR
ncbi:MAG: TonB-dependent receptor, partial [Novosphingobium sp.]|nr:TonB-dependent receptor [Novosphingobium sp.]